MNWIVGLPVLVLLWTWGLVLFLKGGLSRRRKITWAAVLTVVGIVAGLLLSSPVILEKAAIVLILLPILAVIDALVLKPARGLLYWIRACGFELGSVFGAAALTRWLADLASLRPFLS